MQEECLSATMHAKHVGALSRECYGEERGEAWLRRPLGTVAIADMS